MTDINGIIIGIQGNPVNSAAPTDGYVLTWSATDGYWVPRPVLQSGLRKDYFTSSGTWTCPAGVTNILVIAAGGGGGGGGAASYGSGGGGGGSIQQTSYVLVTPGVTYTITIGAGGAGGIGVNPGFIAQKGGNGLSTTFKIGSTILFSAIGAEGGGEGDAVYSNVGGRGGYNFAKNIGSIQAPSIDIFVGQGGDGSTGGAVGTAGQVNYLGQYTGGAPGILTGVPPNGGSGGGGGAGPQGDGADGGIGSPGGGAAPGGNGSSAAANTSAGGGGGGGSVGTIGGDGGDGGSGYMYLVY